ncbi:TOBE domain-containing protein [Haloechinothrix sp. LS1_15]|uniref:TOBE domain-containing protein n=1 Tax=Haloechinothrix sp. LS1_15 TaxID=2652248 RepID=UPI0029464EEA|nr:TOBE domain-containing protein [Haloechinothrix sp. LS1_15]MDV6014379.1 helix-turn-helix domain-containing protein [Haloechinothrix sp. LS1_15]
MTCFRFAEAAKVLGVSDDTIRRWVRSGQLPSDVDSAGRKVIDGAELAAFARRAARREGAGGDTAISRSARNQFEGLVTEVRADGVMAQVEIQAGPHRVVSLMSAEAVAELGLRPGVLAVAVVKATTVVVETAAGRSGR